MMWESRAVGGPRDGVKISAPPTWNGIVRYKIGDGNYKDYPGYYVWRMHDKCEAWVWREAESRPFAYKQFPPMNKGGRPRKTAGEKKKGISKNKNIEVQARAMAIFIESLNDN